MLMGDNVFKIFGAFGLYYVDLFDIIERFLIRGVFNPYIYVEK
jgi:hypothetical protein